MTRGRWLAAGGVLVVAALVVGYHAAERLAQRQVTEALERDLAVEAEIASIEFTSFGREVVAHGVSLRHPQHGLLVRTERLRVRPSLGSLLSGAPDLEQTRMERAEVSLVVRGGHVVNLPTPDGDSGGGAGFARLVLADSTLRVEHEAAALSVHGVRARLERGADGALAIALEGTRGQLTLGAREEPVDTLSARARWNGRRLAVQRLSLASGSLRASLHDAVLSLPLGEDATGHLQTELELATLGGLLGIDDASGHATVDAELKLERGTAHVHGTGTVTDARLGALPLGERVTVDFTLSPQALSFEAGAEQREGGRLGLRGELERTAARALSLRAELQSLDVRGMLAAASPALAGLDPGRLGGSAEVTGTLAPRALTTTLALRAPGGDAAIEATIESDATHAHAAGKLHGASLNGQPLGQLEGEVDLGLGDDVARIAEARGTLEGGAYTLRDVVITPEAGGRRAAGEVELRDVRLGPAASLLGLDTAGLAARLRGSARFDYRTRTQGPDQLDLETDLALSAASLDGSALGAGRLRATLAWHDTGAGLADVVLREGELKLGERLQLSGSATQTALELSLRARGLPTRTLKRVAPVLARLDGRVDLEGTVEGSPDDPRARLSWSLRDVTAGGRRLGNARGDLVVSRAGEASCPEAQAALGALPKQGGARLTSCGAGLGGALRFGLALARGGTRPLRGEVAAEGLPLGALVEGAEGELSGNLRISGGGLANPASLTGTLDVDALSLALAGVMLESPAPTELPIAGGRIGLAGLTLEGDGSTATLSGGAGLDGRLDILLDTTLKASRLPTLTKLVAKARGELALALSLRGTFAEPRVKTTLEARDVTMRLSGFYEPIWHVEGDATLADGRVSVEELSGVLGDGRVRLSGSAAWADGGLDDYDLALEASGVKLEPQRGFELGLGGQARLRSNEGERVPTLSGRVLVSRLSYARHIELQAVLAAIEDFERSSRASYRPEHDAVALELEVVPEGPLQVRNNLMDARVSLAKAGEPLRIGGTDQRPSLRGALSIDGELLFRSNRFVVERGLVTFGDDEPIDPRLEVLAETAPRPDRPATIVMRARGDRKSFGLRLSCSAEPERAPFACAYRRGSFRCDPFAELAALWKCRAATAASAL